MRKIIKCQEKSFSTATHLLKNLHFLKRMVIDTKWKIDPESYNVSHL